MSPFQEWPGWQCALGFAAEPPGGVRVPWWQSRLSPKAAGPTGSCPAVSSVGLEMPVLPWGGAGRSLQGEQWAAGDPELQKAPPAPARWDAARPVCMNTGSHWQSSAQRPAECCGSCNSLRMSTQGICPCLLCRSRTSGFNLCRSFLTFKHSTLLIKCCEQHIKGSGWPSDQCGR